MKPPYTITEEILAGVADCSLLLGRLQSVPGAAPAPLLRRQNQIKTIQGTLAIEGNTLSLDQITAVFDNRPVAGPARDIREVQNAAAVYKHLGSYKPASEKSFLSAHGGLLAGLVPDAGRYRAKNVGVLAGSAVAHVAPPARLVPKLMDDLFRYLKQTSAEHPFIKSTVFHYEVEFIHPFSDGNGRMGRLWQTLMLAQFNPLFAHIPVESIIKERQAAYYGALAASDTAGQCTGFIDFMIEAIRQGISDFYKQFRAPVATAETRLDAAQLHFKTAAFQRQDYMGLFKSLSQATASRDLRSGCDRGILLRTGDKRLTIYNFKKQ